ncbi:MAG: DNA-directed polymerase PolC, partial [Firmicutes bacterium]|nr:DNA-directed polymerase PolC [Bacillota bacterium]
PQVPGDLRALAREDLAARYGAEAPYEQLAKELTVIGDRGQAGYFLALADLVSFARREGIPVGPGRGSAVGSLTAYALGITAIDPVAHRLYFERFLNPERPDLPDIDIDVCSRGRARLIAYLRERHGADRVAHAGVLATLGARGAVREAGRRLGSPREVVDRVAGALPHHGTIDEAVARLPEFQYIDTAREPVRSLLLAARELEGRPWHPSVHAAGVIIAPEPLADLVPLEVAAGGEVITQYSADELEELGLVKIDILGLRNLTVIAAASAEGGIDPERLPLDDPETFRLLASGETIGVFQLDSPGIRNLLRQVRPERMDDLIAVLSLYRPGPFEAGAVAMFTRRRRGIERVTHLHPALAPILDETYGVLLYQEQAMRIAHEVAGMSLADADQLRRSLGKGDASRYRERFLRGCGDRGIPPGIAVQIFGLLERFCGYSFNKAHTAAYALVCYQTAYLKAHAPAPYFAALLAHESGYFGPGVYSGEAERLGVRLLPADVNRSQATYATQGADAIRAGLIQVKDVGPGAVAAILSARAVGPFLGVADFCARVSPRHCRPRTVEALLEAGAFDGLPGAVEGRASREAVVASVKAGRPLAEHRARGQLTLFDLGLALGVAAGPEGAPVANPEPPAHVPTRAPTVAATPHGSAVRLAGPIITARRRSAAGGRIGLTLLLQVGPEQVEVLVPPAIYARDLLAIDPAGITVEGRVQRRGVSMQVVAAAIRSAV